jgi:hypothetical protein
MLALVTTVITAAVLGGRAASLQRHGSTLGVVNVAGRPHSGVVPKTTPPVRKVRDICTLLSKKEATALVGALSDIPVRSERSCSWIGVNGSLSITLSVLPYDRKQFQRQASILGAAPIKGYGDAAGETQSTLLVLDKVTMITVSSFRLPDRQQVNRQAAVKALSRL